MLAAYPKPVLQGAPLNFKSILIVTYGRSGSTLLQGILNTLPDVLVRGENSDLCWGLYLSWKSLVESKNTYGEDFSRDPAHPWYGAMDLDPDDFLRNARSLLRSQIVGPRGTEDVCWGFKEIRYLDHLGDLQNYLRFLSQLMPEVAIVFNVRNHAAVCDSGFWRNIGPVDLRAKLERADRIFFEYASSHRNAFLVRYEDVVRGMIGLAPLFSFLGVEPSAERIDATLRIPHSYAQKPETLSLINGR